jgi:hypothetical protein
VIYKRLTQERLKQVIHYNPETGAAIRIDSPIKSQIGLNAGWMTNGGYRRVRIDGAEFQLHRLIFLYMTGDIPNEFVDHINGLRDDNRYTNLRLVGKAENGRNTKIRNDNTSGHVGVARNGGSWMAYITAAGKTFWFTFKSKDTAINARKSLERLCGYHPNHGRAA